MRFILNLFALTNVPTVLILFLVNRNKRNLLLSFFSRRRKRRREKHISQKKSNKYFDQKSCN